MNYYYDGRATFQSQVHPTASGGIIVVGSYMPVGHTLVVGTPWYDPRMNYYYDGRTTFQTRPAVIQTRPASSLAGTIIGICIVCVCIGIVGYIMMNNNSGHDEEDDDFQQVTTTTTTVTYDEGGEYKQFQPVY